MIYPSGRADVDSLSKVEALIETSMIGAREGDNELATVLVGAIDGYTLLLQEVGIHDGGDMVKEVGRQLKKLTGLLPHCLFEQLRVCWGHAIPCLWLTPRRK